MKTYRTKAEIAKLSRAELREEFRRLGLPWFSFKVFEPCVDLELGIDTRNDPDPNAVPEESTVWSQYHEEVYHREVWGYVNALPLRSIIFRLKKAGQSPSSWDLRSIKPENYIERYAKWLRDEEEKHAPAS